MYHDDTCIPVSCLHASSAAQICNQVRADPEFVNDIKRKQKAALALFGCALRMPTAETWLVYAWRVRPRCQGHHPSRPSHAVSI